MVSIRAFSSEAVFQENTVEWAEKSAVRVRKRTLFSVIDGLFAVWTAAAVNCPSILRSLHPSIEPSSALSHTLSVPSVPLPMSSSDTAKVNMTDTPSPCPCTPNKNSVINCCNDSGVAVTLTFTVSEEDIKDDTGRDTEDIEDTGRV